jgi:uncharacterized membrane protein
VGRQIGRPRTEKEGNVFRGHEAHSRSLAKAVTWRGSASLDTFIISLVFTGKIAVAGSIAATELVTKIALYYFHERIWALVPWGRLGESE